MYSRMTAVFCVILVLMAGMISRVYYINKADYIAMAAQVQGKYRMEVAQTRGVIYDRNRKNLVNNRYRYVASILPTPEGATALLNQTADGEREGLLERLREGRPFVLEVTDQTLYAPGIDIFRVADRYGGYPYAPHLIGYLGDGGVGVAGLEKAYEEILAAAGGEIGVVYQMDAAGRMMDDTAVEVRRKNEDPSGGIILTLDREIQQAAQEALEDGCDAGAAVVLDVRNGDILAMASIPAFDPANVAASLDREDAPFVNRAISGYNIGSVFKLLVSAAALEGGVSAAFSHECQGSIDVEGQVFRCNNNAVHGVCDMERALEVSCNAYFIRLAQEIKPELVLALVQNMGLGSGVELADGMRTQSGNLPEIGELYNPAGYANFSFGQGSSLASPLQMAQAVAAIANGGMAVRPRLYLGYTQDGLHVTDPAYAYASNRVLREETARTLQNLMISVVEKGSGRTAKPSLGGAGGKTSSAQTGQYRLVEGEEEEKEIVHAWFAGFYPADQPQYSVVVFVEGGESGERVAAPIFKRIVDSIAKGG